MARLRLQELLERRCVTTSHLAKVTGLSVEQIDQLATDEVIIDHENIQILQKIADKMDVPTLKLFKQFKRKGAYKLKILEQLEAKKLTLDQLSECTQIEPLLLAIYATQAILEDKFNEDSFQEHLNKINKVLETNSEDLITITRDVPLTRLRLDEIAEENGLTREYFSKVLNLSDNVMNFLATQPIDIEALKVFFNNTNIKGNPVCTIAPWLCRRSSTVV